MYCLLFVLYTIYTIFTQNSHYKQTIYTLNTLYIQNTLYIYICYSSQKPIQYISLTRSNTEHCMLLHGDIFVVTHSSCLLVHLPWL